MLRIFLWTTLLFGSLSLLAQADAFDPDQGLPVDSSATYGQLDNGLQYYYRYNNEPRDRVELRLFVRAGSLQETDEQLGLAHFVEHMAFNGTERFAKQTLVDFLERQGSRFGADLNAYTSFDKTVYKLEVQTDSLAVVDTALQILADWAGGLRIDEAEVDQERGVIRSEWRSSLSYQERLQRQIYPVLFQDSRYATRLPIGDIDLIDTVSAGPLRAYYERWYQPKNMGIAVVGAVDTAWLFPRLAQYFGPLDNQAFTAPKSYALSTRERQDYVLATDAEAPFTRWELIYQLGPVKEQANYGQFRQQLLLQLHGVLLNKRFAGLYEKGIPPFTFAGSRYSTLLDQQRTYELQAMVKPEDFIASLAVVIEETQRAAQYGFQPSELDQAKAALLSNFEEMASEVDKMNSNRWTGRLRQQFYRGLPVTDLQQLPAVAEACLAQITLADLQTVANAWQTATMRTAIVTTNDEAAPLLPDSTRFFQLVDSLLALPTTPPDATQPLSTLLQLPPPTGQPSLVHHDTVIDLRVYELANGIRLYCKPTDFQNDQINFRATSPGGTSLVDPTRYPSARFASSIVNSSGIDTIAASTLFDFLSAKQVSVQSFIGSYQEGMGGNSSQEDLETLFQLAHLYFTRPRTDSLALANFTQRQIDIFEQIDRDPRSAFGRMVSDVKYDFHPRRPNSTVAQIEAINLTDVAAVYRERFANPADFRFVFVGNFNQDTLLRLAQQYLGPLATTPEREQWQDTGLRMRATPLDTLVRAGTTPKGEVTLDWHADFPYADRNARLHASALRQLLNIRLREELREKKGGVYGVRVSVRTTDQPTERCFLNVRFNAEPDQVDGLIQGVYDELRAIAQGEIAESNIEKIKAAQVKSLEERQRDNLAWLYSITTMIRQERPLSQLYFDNYLAFIDTINAADIQAAAERFWRDGIHLKFVLLPQP
ncbi:MAG: insulinase family protein [Bacteroidota bacterium]